jgi:hypothetical protein
MFVSRSAVLALPVAVVLTLGGCSILEPSSAAAPLSELASCALGHTWTQDFAGVVPTVTDELAKRGIAATGVTFAGTQTLDWDEKSHMTVKSDYTVSVTTAAADEQVLTVTETHAGTASGPAYINGDVAIPRKWDDKITVESTADVSGTVQEASPYVIPSTTFDDTVGLIVTCDGNTMTIHPRGTKLTQTWTRAA